MFASGPDYAALYPHDERPRWQFCAPRPERDPPAVIAIRAALLARSQTLGHRLGYDPDLHLIVDGMIVRPQSLAGQVYLFTVPAGSNAVWLASRSTIPAEIEAETSDDRRLGVAIERIMLSDAGLPLEILPGDAALYLATRPQQNSCSAREKR